MNTDALLEEVMKRRFTILLGKNGSGKSTQLRKVDTELHRDDSRTAKYVTPERGGSLTYDPNVENQMSENHDWMPNTRRSNRFDKFRQQSAAQFRKLEMQVLRQIEADPALRGDHSYTFNTVLGEINDLLPAIMMKRTDSGFEVYGKAEGSPKIDNKQISSGESELIALAIEILVFSRSDSPNKILLLDEPDVHLHPDLQYRLGQFLIRAAKEGAGEGKDFRVVIATHSTALTSAFADESDAQVIPFTNVGQEHLTPFALDEISKALLPIFGVHPLSQQFIQSPILLVEGEDDKRVFDHVVRSSNGQTELWPCPVGGVTELSKWERWLDDYLPAIYDVPVAFSLRDRDDGSEDIEDQGIVKRARLGCRAIENILLCEQSLAHFNHTEDSYKDALRKWLTTYSGHSREVKVRALLDGFDDRDSVCLKEIRNIVVALLDTEKPWEAIVGQLLARYLKNGDTTDSKHCVTTYLGKGVLDKILVRS